MHVLYSFPTRVGVSGIGMTAWHQLAGLTDLGVRVTLFCGSCERPVPGLHRMNETMRIAGIPIPYRLLGNDRAFALHDRVVAKAIRKQGREYDVVHCWPRGSLETLKAAKQMGVKSVLERPNAHTAFAYEVVAKEHAKLGLPVPPSHTHAFNAKRLAREEREYSLADKLACPSDFVAKTFIDRGFPISRIARHQYGYSPEEFHPNGAHRSDQRFTIIFVGRCEPRKGLHYALEAWHRSGAADCGRFIICGTYVDGYRDVLRRWLGHRSIEERGFVANISAVMQEADALVLPSMEEGSALVTYEARACGCMLLISDAAGAPCEHMVDGLVHSAGDVTMLTQHLTLLATDTAVLDRLRDGAGRNSGKYSWAAAAEQLCRLYSLI